MLTITCHPDNAVALRRQISSDVRITELELNMRIIPNPLMDRTTPSGRYWLPDGRLVDKQDIEVRTRFITYGPEDLDWLLFARIIREDSTRLFYIVQDVDWPKHGMRVETLDWDNMSDRFITRK